MVYHVIPAIIVVILIMIGHFIKRRRITSYNKRGDFTTEFNNKFFDFVNETFSTNHIDSDKYSAVIMEVDNIQQELGMDGVLNSFYDPLRGMQGRNYQLFMNIMPEIRTAISERNNSIMMERINQLMGLCDDALKRHIGNLERAIEDEKKGLFNPITCLGEGIRWIVGLPVDVLCWAGLYGVSRSQKIKVSTIFKIISNIIVVIGLISSIVTIALGWDEFLIMLQNCIGRK